MCFQESGLKAHQPASFAVSLNGARGALQAQVHGPSGALEECHVTEIDQGEPPSPSPQIHPSQWSQGLKLRENRSAGIYPPSPTPYSENPAIQAPSSTSPPNF